MCGIAGLWQGRPPVEVALGYTAKAMAQSLAHRGPDSGGSWVDGSAGIALAHRRLAILDLSPAGHQPMVSADENLVLVFNGEIYNHLALRQELEQSGPTHNWRGHSDTETLLAAFATWGVTATLQKAVGMFAMALWNKRDETLHLARDRMGEKPLYYGWAGGAFAFASELKALRLVPGFDSSVDRDALSLYMQFGYVPAPHSIYRDIYKLLPGTTLAISAEDVSARRLQEPEAYWSVADAARAGLENPIEDEGYAVSALEAALKDAVAGQMIADVPLGAFLSGGVDSSTVVALMQAQSSRPVQTFTVGFDEAGYDEAPHAAAVARHLRTDHHEIRVSAADALAVVPRLPDLYDEPFADSSQIPTFLVCAAARGTVTVALSGDGADELFGGYNRYFWGSRIWSRLSWLPLPLRKVLGVGLLAIPATAWDAASGLLPHVTQAGDKAHKLGRRLKSVRSMDDLYHSLVTEWPRGSGIVLGARPLPALSEDSALVDGIPEAEQRMMLWDSLTYLPDDILTKVDRAAMGISLETRVPFLDHRVVELAWRLPIRMKIRGGQGKWALRQVLYRYVPRELIERPKAGFAVPLADWLRGPLRDWAEDLLAEPRMRRQGYLDVVPIRARWVEHLSGRRDWTPSLWSVLMFQSWLERHQAN